MMKKIMKSTVLMFFTVFMVFGFAKLFSTVKVVLAAAKSLGASQACEEHRLEDFNRVPACIDEYGNLHICENNFPDVNFRKYVEALTNGTTLTVEDCSKIIKLTLDPGKLEISDISGIEFFISLKELYCSVDQFEVREKKLTNINLSNNESLEVLECGYNEVSELDVSHNKLLKILNCEHNKLSKLDISHNGMYLKELNCENNQLSELDVTHNPGLEILWCNYNQLSQIDLRKNKALKELVVGGNPLKNGLDVTNNLELETLGCYMNQLKTLDISHNKRLKKLVCPNNFLKELNCMNNPELNDVYSYNNFILEIDLSDHNNFTNYFSWCNSGNMSTFQVNGQWKVNLAQYFSQEKLQRISLDEAEKIATYDSETGVLTFVGEPQEFRYTYDTGGLYLDGNKVMHYTKITPIKCKHSNTRWEEIPASCTKDGYKEEICIDCGNILQNIESEKARGHQFGQWKEIQPVTCIQDGKQERICNICQFVDTREIKTQGHSWENEFTIDKVATTTGTGLKSIHCQRCNAVKDITEIPMLKKSTKEKNSVKNAKDLKLKDEFKVPQTGENEAVWWAWGIVCMLALGGILNWKYLKNKSSK